MRTPIRVGQTGTQGTATVFTAYPPTSVHVDRDRFGWCWVLPRAGADHRDLPIEPIFERGHLGRLRSGGAVLLQSSLLADELGALDRAVRERLRRAFLQYCTIIAGTFGDIAPLARRTHADLIFVRQINS